jgi:hypothetical protein
VGGEVVAGGVLQASGGDCTDTRMATQQLLGWHHEIGKHMCTRGSLCKRGCSLLMCTVPLLPCIAGFRSLSSSCVILEGVQG